MDAERQPDERGGPFAEPSIDPNLIPQEKRARAMHRRLQILLGLTLVLGGNVYPIASEAAEDELIIALTPEGVGLNQLEGSSYGAGGALSAWLGLNDTFWLTGTTGHYALFPSDDAKTQWRWELTAGLVAAWDVFQIVPFVDLGLGLVGNDRSAFAAPRVSLGADYILGPTWAVGVSVGYRPLPRDLGDGLATAGLRIVQRFQL